MRVHYTLQNTGKSAFILKTNLLLLAKSNFPLNSGQQHFIATVIYMTSAYTAFCVCYRNMEVCTNVCFNKINNSNNLVSIALYS